MDKVSDIYERHNCTFLFVFCQLIFIEPSECPCKSFLEGIWLCFFSLIEIGQYLSHIIWSVDNAIKEVLCPLFPLHFLSDLSGDNMRNRAHPKLGPSINSGFS